MIHAARNTQSGAPAAVTGAATPEPRPQSALTGSAPRSILRHVTERTFETTVNKLFSEYILEIAAAHHSSKVYRPVELKNYTSFVSRWQYKQRTVSQLQ